MTRRAILCAALMLLLTTPAAGQGPGRLSEDHEQRLAGGDIVVLDQLPPGGDVREGHGGTAMAFVRATPEAVWRLLVDYAGHAGLYPRVTDARVLEAGGARTVVRYVVGVGPFSFDFHVANFPEPARGRLVWRLAHERPNDLFRDTWGYWQIVPRADGCIVTYAMAARTVLPAFLTRGAGRDGLVETLRAVRARAEGRTL
ncbi:MAG TPA: SRPBCC family protein [Candidatus Tectomicrobia bacterium]|nr:SRPBCC family protein [Candidatus Tectomicrobia bacterium]